VIDGSALPTSGAVNPSLTIAAVALRAADHLVSEAPS
jgi:choline dehydrogenase-like flavoprotein